MHKGFIFAGLLVIFLLAGCGTLLDIAQNPSGFIEEARPNVTAAGVLAGNAPDTPLSEGIALAVGYGLALLRRWYKDKKKIG